MLARALLVLAIAATAHAVTFTATWTTPTTGDFCSGFTLGGAPNLAACSTLSIPATGVFNVNLNTAVNLPNSTLSLGGGTSIATNLVAAYVTAAATFGGLTLDQHIQVQISTGINFTVQGTTAVAAAVLTNDDSSILAGEGANVFLAGVDLNSNKLTVDSRTTVLSGASTLNGQESLLIGGGQCTGTVALNGMSSLLFTSNSASATLMASCVPTGSSTATLSFQGQGSIPAGAYGTKIIVASDGGVVSTYGTGSITVAGLVSVNGQLTTMIAFAANGNLATGAGALLYVHGGAVTTNMLTLASGGAYQLYVDSMTPAALTSSGSASLDGQLIVTLSAAFAATITADTVLSFPVVTYASHVGTFSSVQVMVESASTTGGRRLLQSSDCNGNCKLTVQYQDKAAVASNGKTNAAPSAHSVGAGVVLAAATAAVLLI